VVWQRSKHHYQKNQSRIDLHNPNELQGHIQQLIKHYGKDSAERHHREGCYPGRFEQLKELWQQFCDLDEEVQQAALPTGSEYASRLAALKELVKYQKIFLDNMPTENGPPKALMRTSANIKSLTGNQVKIN